MVGRLLWIPMCKSVGAFPDPRDNGSGGKKRILRIYLSLNGSQPPFLFMKDRWSWTPSSNCGNTGNMPIQEHSTFYRKSQKKREDCPEKKEIMRGIEQRDLQKLILRPKHIYLIVCCFLVWGLARCGHEPSPVAYRTLRRPGQWLLIRSGSQVKNQR